MRYEYRLFNIKNPGDLINPEIDIRLQRDDFNRLGKEGWELISVWDNTTFFKRQQKKSL